MKEDNFVRRFISNNFTEHQIEDLNVELKESGDITAYIHLTEVSTDDSDIFKDCEDWSSLELTPEYEDNYLNTVFGVFPNIEGKTVIVFGSHSGAATSDDGYSAHFIGHIDVVSQENSDVKINQTRKEHVDALFLDLRNRVSKMTYQLRYLGEDEKYAKLDNNFLKEIFEFNREISTILSKE